MKPPKPEKIIAYDAWLENKTEYQKEWRLENSAYYRDYDEEKKV